MVPCLFPSCTLHKNRIVPLPWGHPFVRAPAALDASAIFAVGHAPAQAGAHQRAPILTFVRPRRRLTFAPTADHRGRRAQTMSRLAAFQRPPKAWPLHRRARRHAGGVGSIFLSCCSFAGLEAVSGDQTESLQNDGRFKLERNEIDRGLLYGHQLEQCCRQAGAWVDLKSEFPVPLPDFP